ncbi:MAG: invasion associated locus B family protein [Magnetospirillum sp. WYHS-4]
MKLLAPILAILACLVAGLVWAAAAKHVGAFETWNVFTTTEGGKKICYMASHPTKSDNSPAKRADAMVLITHYPADKVFNEVAVQTGFAVKEGQDVDALIGGASFKLFFKDGAGWNRDASGDKAMVQSMRSGNSLIAKAIPVTGKLVEDTYSLKGFGAAHDALNKACGAP